MRAETEMPDSKVEQQMWSKGELGRGSDEKISSVELKE